MIYSSLLHLGVMLAPGFVVATELTKTKNPVPGHYIVTLDGEHRRLSSSSLGDFIQEIIQGDDIGAQSHGTVDQVYESVFTGFAADLDETGLQNVLNNSNVVSVEEDGYVQLDQATWGLDRIDDEDLPLDGTYEPTFGKNGEGVTVYIIDTGILHSHEEFENRALTLYNNVDDGKNYDCHGHGTHVAGTVGAKNYGVANKAKLVGVKVLECSGSGTIARVIAGVNWVKANAKKPATANMSLNALKNTALNAAVKALIASGVSTVVAAGNIGGSNRDACSYSPASEPDAITVGSTDNRDARSPFSNYGKCVDIFAPGSNIISPYVGSNSALRTMSGTSMASPHVCGAAALYLGQNPNLTPSALATKILQDSIADTITDVGSGSPNKFLYVGGGHGTNPPTPAPTPVISCDGKNKAQCKKLKEFCVFGKKKIPGNCKPKKSKYNKNCGYFDAEDTCLNKSEGNCLWDGECTHRCDHGLAQKDCKKITNPEDNNRKMCKAKMLSNPCKGCQSKTTCG